MESVSVYCVDSDILIDYLRGFEKARVFLLKAAEETPLYISMLSVVEIYAGEETKSEDKRKAVEEFLSNFHIIELTLPIAKRAGELRRDLKKPFADMIIAASAIDRNAVLVTKNSKHFSDVKDLEILKPY